MSEQPTTPQGPAGSPQPEAPRPKRASTARVVSVVIAAAGGLVLVTVGALAAVSAIDRGGSATSSTLTSGTTGITGVDVDISAADFTLEFDDVDEAVLEVTGPHSDRWQLKREGNELQVDTARKGWLDFCFGWCQPSDQEVVLTLPRALGTGVIDAEIDLSAGSARAYGAFRSLNVDISAGSVSLEGSAKRLGVDMSAGRLDVQLSDVAEAALDVSAGSIEGTLTGDAPRDITIDLSAGSVRLTLPDVEYSLDSDISAGSIDSTLRTRSSSPHQISAQISAGKITLSPGR